MNKAQHTPTPWKLLAGTYYDGAERKIVSGDRNSSLYVLVGGSEGIRDENAALIVNAVNCHKELLRKVKLLIQLDDECRANPKRLNGLLSNVRQEVLDLIAQAEIK